MLGEEGQRIVNDIGYVPVGKVPTGDDRTSSGGGPLMGGSSKRRTFAIPEPLVEWTIRICGWSAIFFVFAIFFFVFREAAPALFGPVDFLEFFTSILLAPGLENPAPVRHPCADRRHGFRDAARDVGRGSDGPRGGRLRFGILRTEARGRRSRSSSSCWPRFPRSFGDSSATWFSIP